MSRALIFCDVSLGVFCPSSFLSWMLNPSQALHPLARFSSPPNGEARPSRSGRQLLRTFARFPEQKWCADRVR